MAVSNRLHMHTRVLANNSKKNHASNTTPHSHRTAGCSDLGDLTQARDLASFIVHCEEHGRGLRGMRLEELQGFVQGLWGKMLSGQAWGRERHSPPCTESAEPDSPSTPAAHPLLKASAGPRRPYGEKDPSTRPCPHSDSEVCLPPPRAVALWPPDLPMAPPNLNSRKQALRSPLHSEPQSSHFSHQRTETPTGDK